MRPKAIKNFELLYFGAIALVLANAVRDYDALRDSAGGDLVRRGLDPDTLLIASIAFMVGIMLVFWFMTARLRIGFVRYLMLGLLIWQGWELSSIIVNERGSSVIVGVAAVVLQAVAVAFSFVPTARAWFAAEAIPLEDHS
jgi:hypothetical protein